MTKTQTRVSIPTHHLIGHVIVGAALWYGIFRLAAWIMG